MHEKEIEEKIHNLPEDLRGGFLDYLDFLLSKYQKREIVEKFAKGIGSKLIGFIPKTQIVQDCERDGRTVIENEPNSDIAKIYRKLASDILSNTEKALPNALEIQNLRNLTKF